MIKIEFKDLPSEDTPIDAEHLNTLQDNIEKYQYHLELETDTADNSQIELPAYYQVGDNVLEVYFEGCLLKKDENYTEVGETGSLSNKIQIKQWGDTIDSGSSFDFVIQGTYGEEANANE